MTKRPTIVDVAKLAGVSKATVGRVVAGQHDIVSQDTRHRVEDAINQLGYERNAIAGSLRTDKTYMIALLIPDITNPFWPAVARGVQDTLEKYDYTVVTVNSDWDTVLETKYLRMVRRNRFDGIIINPTNSLMTNFSDMDIPIVVLSNGDDYPDFDTVSSDTETAVQESLDYLYELGHRRIGLIAGLSTRRKLTTRYQSYLAFLARKHLPLDEDIIVHGDFTIQAGMEAMKHMLSLSEPPTAIFAANDILAIGAMQTARAAGWQIPENISIMGMDDIFAASTTYPPLTTVAKPKYELGVKAADLLLAQLQHGPANAPEHHKLRCELLTRGSTAPPMDT